MLNGIQTLKRFKRYFEQDSIVKLYCDNSAIESEDHPATQVLKRQICQLEDRWDCDIQVFHETIRDGNKLVQAANELSRGRVENCQGILAGLGARPLGVLISA
jgi:hypothetical protein